MKLRLHIIKGLVLGTTLLIAGCEKEEPAKTPVPAPPPPPVTPQASAGGGSGSTAEGLPAAKSGIASGTTGPAATRSSAGAAQDITIAPVDDSAAKSKQAQDLLERAIQSIQDKNLDDARDSLAEVEAMQADLPETIRKQLKTVRGSLESVERLQNPSLPAPTEPDNK